MKEITFSFLRVSVKNKTLEVVSGLSIDHGTDLFLQNGTIKNNGDGYWVVRGFRRDFFWCNVNSSYLSDSEYSIIEPEFYSHKKNIFDKLLSLPGRYYLNNWYYFLKDDNNDDVVELLINDCTFIKNYKK